MTPNFAPKPLGLPRIPVAIAAVGPAMQRVAGEVCDGIRLHPFNTRKHLAEVELDERLRPYPERGRWTEMAALISDEVVELFATVGTHDEIAGKIEARYGGLVDAISMFIPTDTPVGPLKEVAQDIARIKTPFEGYAAGW
jgi:alkanesulfonate monooxygenase SsuD/methylene tetrahydromethanopterin reductase-like flavin-dependent oxidoreductase (luciferase family)